MPPPVSWLLPIRNGERHLEQTLRSIAHQDYTRQEVLVWDDGSSDRTVEILNQWLGSRIPGRIVGHQRVGLGRALAHLVVESKSELLARIDADDTAEPTRLSEQSKYLVSNRRVGVLGTHMKVIGEPERVVTQPLDDATIRWSLRFTNPVSHPSVMMRRSAVLEVGNYRDLPAGKEDYDLWARLGIIVQFATLPRYLTHYRVHEDSATAGWSADHGRSFYEQRNALMDRLLPGIPASDAIRLLDLVRRPEDLGVTGDDLMRFRHAAMCAARACRFPATYFTQTDLFKQQYENLRTRWIKGQPFVRPVWPIIKKAGKLINKQSDPSSNDTAAA